MKYFLLKNWYLQGLTAVNHHIRLSCLEHSGLKILIQWFYHHLAHWYKDICSELMQWLAIHTCNNQDERDCGRAFAAKHLCLWTMLATHLWWQVVKWLCQLDNYGVKINVSSLIDAATTVAVLSTWQIQLNDYYVRWLWTGLPTGVVSGDMACSQIPLGSLVII